MNETIRIGNRTIELLSRLRREPIGNSWKAICRNLFTVYGNHEVVNVGDLMNPEHAFHVCKAVTSGRPVCLLIDSPGGALYSGLRIAEAVCQARSEGRFVPCVVKRAFSAAGKIAACCYPRAIDRRGQFMIHNVSGVSDPANRHQVEAILFDVLAAASSCSRREYATAVHDACGGDVFLSAEDAMLAGLVDHFAHARAGQSITYPGRN